MAGPYRDATHRSAAQRRADFAKGAVQIRRGLSGISWAARESSMAPAVAEMTKAVGDLLDLVDSLLGEIQEYEDGTTHDDPPNGLS